LLVVCFLKVELKADKSLKNAAVIEPYSCLGLNQQVPLSFTSSSQSNYYVQACGIVFFCGTDCVSLSYPFSHSMSIILCAMKMLASLCIVVSMMGKSSRAFIMSIKVVYFLSPTTSSLTSENSK